VSFRVSRVTHLHGVTRGGVPYLNSFDGYEIDQHVRFLQRCDRGWSDAVEVLAGIEADRAA
jgi:hypothetical protein